MSFYSGGPRPHGPQCEISDTQHPIWFHSGSIYFAAVEFWPSWTYLCMLKPYGHVVFQWLVSRTKYRPWHDFAVQMVWCSLKYIIVTAISKKYLLWNFVESSLRESRDLRKITKFSKEINFWKFCYIIIFCHCMNKFKFKFKF